MIVNDTPRGLCVVRQPDHAALSAQVATAWRRPGSIPVAMWPRFIDAVRRHDDGWIEEERVPRLDADGRPYDFKRLPAAVHTALWRRGVQVQKDPFAALLVARHGKGLYLQTRDRSDDDGGQLVRELIAEMDSLAEAAAASLRRGDPAERAAAEPARLGDAQRLFTFFDAMSLMLLGGIPPTNRTQGLPFGTEDRALSLAWTGEQDLALSPWPLEVPSLEVNAPRVILPRARFSSPAGAARELTAAPLLPFVGRLGMGSTP